MLCFYLYNDACPKRITGLRRVSLDGETLDAEEPHGETLFAIDTFEIM